MLSSCHSTPGIAEEIEGTKEHEFGIWQEEVPPPALKCLLETSVVEGRGGSAPAKGLLQNFNPELWAL